MANVNVDVEIGDVDIIRKTVQLLVDCEEKGRIRRNQLKPSIYMVPKIFKDQSPSSFNPRFVSIGPLHRQDSNLQEFEEEKVSCLHDFLRRLNLVTVETLNACVHKVSGSIIRIRASYAAMGESRYNDIELAKMMVMDGIFILDFLYNVKVKGEPELPQGMSIAISVIFDFLLLENQIPFFVLEDIFKCTILKVEPMASLIELILPLLEAVDFMDRDNILDNVGVDTTHDHILGLLHKSYQPGNDNVSKELSVPKAHSAIELDRAGVKFKKNRNTTWSMAMKMESSRFACHLFPWCPKPTLGMPKMYINDFTELVLRNLIVYEQSCEVRNYVSGYVYAMYTLINTPEDITKLVESQVLDSDFGSNEDAANMINNIIKDFTVVEFYYYEQWRQLDIHYNNGYWPTNISALKRTYFNSPWNMIALFAGILLFALTIIQTIYTIKASNNPTNGSG